MKLRVSCWAMYCDNNPNGIESSGPRLCDRRVMPSRPRGVAAYRSEKGWHGSDLGHCRIRVMNFATVFIAAISLLFVCGCATRGPKVLASGDDAAIKSEALRSATADIAARHPRICYAGTIAAVPVGVPSDSYNLVRGLPRFPLPSGCTDLLAVPAEKFAEAYNAAIVQYLQQHKKD